MVPLKAPMDELFLFEKPDGVPNSAGLLIEFDGSLTFEKFKKWAKDVFAKKHPLG